MLGFEIEIMIIRIGSKSNFFYFGRFTFGFHFFFLLLLIVKEFIVINDLAYRRISRWRNLNKIKLLFLRNPQSILGIINSYFYIFSYQPYLRNLDKMIDAMFSFFARDKSAPEATFVKTTWFVEATAASARFESAATGLESTLLYCHLNCLVKPPFPQGEYLVFIFPQ